MKLLNCYFPWPGTTSEDMITRNPVSLSQSMNDSLFRKRRLGGSGVEMTISIVQLLSHLHSILTCFNLILCQEGVMLLQWVIGFSAAATLNSRKRLCLLDSFGPMLLSHFSHVRLCVTPQTAAHQAPPSLGFSRQEHWSGVAIFSPMHESEKWKWNPSVVSDS